MIWNEIANNPAFKIEDENHFYTISNQLINSQERLDPELVDLVVSRVALNNLRELNPLDNLFHFLEKKAILHHKPAPNLKKLCEDRARYYEFDMLRYLRRLGHESELASFLLAVNEGNEKNYLDLIDKIDPLEIPNSVFSKVERAAADKLLARKIPPLTYLLANQKLPDEFTADLIRKRNFIILNCDFDKAFHEKKLETFEALKQKKPRLDPFISTVVTDISRNASVVRHFRYRFSTLNYGLPSLKKTASTSEAASLSVNGFVDLEKTTHLGGYEVELYQGTKEFRSHFYQLSRRNIHALSPKSLRGSAAININNYLILMMKRVAHVWGFTITMKSASGREVLSKGFHESFTIPFWIDALNNLLLNATEHQSAFEYVIKQLRNVYILEHMTEEDKTKLIEKLNSPETVEPLIFCSGHVWHLTIFGIVGKKAFYCDRGRERVNGVQSYSRKISAADKYHIFSLLNRMETLKGNHYDELALISSFGLNLEKVNQMTIQKTGTCTHTSVDALISQLLNIYYQDDAKGREAYKLATAFYRTYVLHHLFKDPFELNKELYYDLFYAIAFKLQKNKLDAFTPTIPYRDKVYAALNKLSQK